jgi:hypothetical protein
MPLQNALVHRHEGTGFTPGGWDRTMLAVGDSWMDVSGLVNDSLPHFLKFEDRVLIAQIARIGNRLTTFDKTITNRYLKAILNDMGGNYKFSHVLMSAGGNDFIDAVTDVTRGEGLLKDFRGKKLPVSANACINKPFLDQLVLDLNASFAQMLTKLRSSSHVLNAPVLCNCYDVPKVREKGIAFIAKSWIKRGLENHGIDDPDLQQRVSDLMFSKVASVVQGWEQSHKGVFAVPTSGTIKQATATKDNDWLNEIHPNSIGWEKHSRIWEKLISAKT